MLQEESKTECLFLSFRQNFSSGAAIAIERHEQKKGRRGGYPKRTCGRVLLQKRRESSVFVETDGRACNGTESTGYALFMFDIKFQERMMRCVWMHNLVVWSSAFFCTWSFEDNCVVKISWPPASSSRSCSREPATPAASPGGRGGLFCFQFCGVRPAQVLVREHA